MELGAVGKGQTEVVENHILFFMFSIPPFFPQTSYFFYFVPNNYIIQILEVLILLIILSGDLYSR